MGLFFIFYQKLPSFFIFHYFLSVYTVLFLYKFFKKFFKHLKIPKNKGFLHFIHFRPLRWDFFLYPRILYFTPFIQFSPLKWDFILCFTNQTKCRILKNVNNYFGQKLVIHNFKVY